MKTNEYINKVRTTLKHFVAGATMALVAWEGCWQHRAAMILLTKTITPSQDRC